MTRHSRRKLTPKIPKGWIDPVGLEKGKAYIVNGERPTIIMPKRRLEDIDLDNPKPMRKMEPGGKIEILEIENSGNAPWYRVLATDLDGEEFGEGWVNSINLMGQTISLSGGKENGKQ